MFINKPGYAYESFNCYRSIANGLSKIPWATLRRVFCSLWSHRSGTRFIHSKQFRLTVTFSRLPNFYTQTSSVRIFKSPRSGTSSPPPGWKKQYNNHEILTIGGLLEVDIGVAERAPGDGVAAHAYGQHGASRREFLEEHGLGYVAVQVAYVERGHRVVWRSWIHLGCVFSLASFLTLVNTSLSLSFFWLARARASRYYFLCLSLFSFFLVDLLVKIFIFFFASIPFFLVFFGSCVRVRVSLCVCVCIFKCARVRGSRSRHGGGRKKMKRYCVTFFWSLSLSISSSERCCCCCRCCWPAAAASLQCPRGKSVCDLTHALSFLSSIERRVLTAAALRWMWRFVWTHVYSSWSLYLSMIYILARFLALLLFSDFLS